MVQDRLARWHYVVVMLSAAFLTISMLDVAAGGAHMLQLLGGLLVFVGALGYTWRTAVDDGAVDARQRSSHGSPLCRVSGRLRRVRARSAFLAGLVAVMIVFVVPLLG